MPYGGRSARSALRRLLSLNYPQRPTPKVIRLIQRMLYKNNSMKFVENVIPAVNRYLEEGRRAALVTLVNIEGSSPRPLGSQLGVADDGRHAGMITGGCAEKAIVAEAVQCLAKDENKLVRYGAGSPYVDVILPCGSGIDLYIETKSVADIVPITHQAQGDRQPISMEIDTAQLKSAVLSATESSSADIFVKTYAPEYRIYAFGEGANLFSFCALAHQAGVAVEAFSPDRETLAFLKEEAINTHAIHLKSDFSALEFDAHTAVVTLFHEHEWESNILHAALNADADYVGALGSRVTHQTRLDGLAAMAATKRPATMIHGPVGLDIGAKNPNEIAISIIAEIIEHRRRRNS